MGRGEESIAMEVFSKAMHAENECQRFEFKEKQVNQRTLFCIRRN
jgi:hypothetical protein